MDQIKDVKLGETNHLYLQIERKRKDGSKETETVRIEPDELLQMTDDTKSYNLKHYPRPFKPKYVLDFDCVQGECITALYSVGHISVKEYCAFCRARLEASIKLRFPQRSNLPVYIMLEIGAYHDETPSAAIEALKKRAKFCARFFTCCLPKAVAERYDNNFSKMIAESQGVKKFREEQPSQIVKIGGKVYGFFTDDNYEIRPLTSRKEEVVELYPDCVLDEFRIAFLEELKKLEAEAQQTDENRP